MKNYTAQDIATFMNQHEKQFTHVVVAHTHFRPYNKSKVQIQMMQTEAQRRCRYALNCFYASLYPAQQNKIKRYPDRFKPLTFVTIEGAHSTTDKAQTIHFNITLGNLPQGMTTEQIEQLFLRAWVHKAGQSQNVYAQAYYKKPEKDWSGYTLKEANDDKHKAWSTDGVWDVENCWIPTQH